MNRSYDKDDDYLDFSDSDVERADSSEDDIDILLHGTPEQKRKLCKKTNGEASSSEDEFEKEMNQILNDQVEAIEEKRCMLSPGDKPGTSTSNSEQSGRGQVPGQKFYDDIYFDSDEEEMIKEGEKRQKQRQEVLSNDDLLYDPNLDEEDQKWIDNERKKYLPKEEKNDLNNEAKKQKNASRRLPHSDAVLNCPACMTELCLDCQRHSTYQHQYRAMFVKNCSVDYNENLSYPCEKTKKNKRRKNQHKTEQDSTTNTIKPDDCYHPVKCTECNTVVAVFDRDEVYHFFNILASYS